MKYKYVNRILIFKLCCLGDIIFMTPSIAALRKKFPDSEIVLIASEWVAALSPYLKHIDRIIYYNPPISGNFLKKLFSFFRLIGILRKERFDMAFLGHRASVFGMVLKLSRIRYRLGFRGTKFLNLTSGFDENIHESSRYLKILSENGIEPDILVPELKQENSRSDIRKQHRIPEKKFVIGMFPFGGVNPGTIMHIKRWDFENYLRAAGIINKNFPDGDVILFEGKQSGEEIDRQKLVNNSKIRINKINIDLISVCDIFISGDTGPLHIAAAFGIPTLGIFGPSDPKLVMPVNHYSGVPGHRYIWKKPACSPCYTPATAVDRSNSKYWNGNEFKCYTGTHECIEEITPSEVFAVLKEMIEIEL